MIRRQGQAKSVRIATVALGVVTACAVAACSLSWTGSEPAVDVVRPIWPQPPAKARIEWRSQFRGPRDLGIRPGAVGRLWNWISGKSAPLMVRPHAVSVDDRGRIWVTDPGAMRVHVFDPDKHLYMALPKKFDPKPSSPIGIAHDANGVAYVSDSLRAVIRRYDADGRSLPDWKMEGELVRPTGLAYDRRQSTLWVVDTGTHSILALNAEGRVEHRVGGRGDGPGLFNFPTHISVDGEGIVYVADTLNFRVQLFSPQGEFLSMWGEAGDGPGSLSRPKGISVDNDGHIYVVDSVFENVQIFDRSGLILLYFGEPGIAVGQFWLPTGLFISGGNRIYVADSYNRRVQIFDYLGG